MRPLLYGYIFLVIYRPFEFWTELAGLRLELWYSLALVTAWLFHGRKRFAVDGLTLAVGGFFLALVTCWLCSPWVEHGYETVYRCFPYFVFFLLLSTVEWTSDDLCKLLWCFVLVFFGYMIHSLIEYMNGRLIYRMGIVRLVGIDQALGDPNSFAASVVYTLALIAPLWASSSGSWPRLILVGFIVVGVLCIALTGSRAGFVSLVVLYALGYFQSSHRGLHLGLGAVAALAFAFVMPDVLQDRFLSIVDADFAPLSARVSAESRVEGFLQGLATWNEYFFTGAGPGCWRLATGLSVESHNLYGQLCAELGLAGIGSFGFMLGAYLCDLRCVGRQCQTELPTTSSFVSRLRSSLAILLVLLLLNGMFAHNLYRYTWIWAAAFLCGLRHLTETQALRRLSVWTQAPMHDSPLAA